MLSRLSSFSLIHSRPFSHQHRRCRELIEDNVLLVVVSLATPASALAQLASPNSNGIAIGHVHVNATDIEAQSRFWTQLGGKVIQREKLAMVQFPGIYVILRKQDPTGGTIGTTMNHFGFYVKDFKASVARWQAAGLPWEPVTTNPAVGQGFMTGPDGVRVEIYEDKTIGPPMQMHHIHLVVPDPPAAQAWYVQHFSAVAGKRLGGVEAVRTQFDRVVVNDDPERATGEVAAILGARRANGISPS
jgi:catechol 2,3-dioxygenase-like lactoylglutathione lyase family enzyme